MLTPMFRSIVFISKKNNNISPKNFNSISHSSSVSENINENQLTQSKNFEADISLNSKESTNNNEEKVENKPKESSFLSQRQELVAKLLTKGEKIYKNKKLLALEKQKKFIS